MGTRASIQFIYTILLTYRGNLSLVEQSPSFLHSLSIPKRRTGRPKSLPRNRSKLCIHHRPIILCLICDIKAPETRIRLVIVTRPVWSLGDIIISIEGRITITNPWCCIDFWYPCPSLLRRFGLGNRSCRGLLSRGGLRSVSDMVDFDRHSGSFSGEGCGDRDSLRLEESFAVAMFLVAIPLHSPIVWRLLFGVWEIWMVMKYLACESLKGGLGSRKRRRCLRLFSRGWRPSWGNRWL